MNVAALDALLHATLADHKLSGSEKSTLTAFAMKEIDSEQDRAVARSRVFEIARTAATDEAARKVLGWVEDALKALAPGQAAPAGIAPSEAYFSPGEACLAAIANRFSTARTSVDICVFTITDDRIARAILDAHRRGVKVRILTDNDKAFDEGSDIERLGAAGIPVKVDRTPFHMHHKFAIFDATRLITGSYNWTRGAARDNLENVIDTGDPRLLTAFRHEFEAIWEKL